MWRPTFITALVFVGLGTLFAQDESNESGDTSAGLPKEYADYLIASATLSPNKKFAVIYPKAELCLDQPKKGSKDRCKDYLVALQRFQILTALDTRWPEFENKNRGGITATWLKDGSAVLVTLDSRWGPGAIFLYEIRDGKLSRSTNLLKKVHDLLVPDFKQAKVGGYNAYFDFLFVTNDTPIYEFTDSTHVRIRGTATTDPKHVSWDKVWDGAVEATWDIPNAKFISQKVSRKFAGVRK